MPIAGETTVIGRLPIEVRGLAEGFDFDFGLNDSSNIFSFTALNDGIYAGEGMDGGNTPDPNVVPEPSSGAVWLLLVVCVALGKRVRNMYSIGEVA